MTYTAKGKAIDELFEDFESGLLAQEFKGVTMEYLQAAISAIAAESQRRWARVAAFAACFSVAVAVAALLVAAL
jgi:hypothetical protein